MNDWNRRDLAVRQGIGEGRLSTPNGGCCRDPERLLSPNTAVVNPASPGRLKPTLFGHSARPMKIGTPPHARIVPEWRLISRACMRRCRGRVATGIPASSLKIANGAVEKLKRIKGGVG